MAKRKRRRSSGFSTQTLMKFIRLGALGIPALQAALDPSLSGDRKLTRALSYYTGYDFSTGKFNWQLLAQGWTPYAASVAVTYGIPKLAGILRRI